MLRAVCTLAALVTLAPVVSAQEPSAALDSIAAAHRPLVRQRAMHCYKMPDGTIWDGANYFEQRKILDYTFKPFSQVEKGEGTGAFVEDRVVGTIWKVKPTREARAWGLIGYLAGEDGEVEKGRFEQADRRQWRDAPPLWTCAEMADFAWPFAYFDESQPDDYTRTVRKGYLEITRDWGEGAYDFKGYSLDRGRLEGVVHITEPLKWIKRDRFKGEFFLWPTTRDEARGQAGQHYQLIPAADARISADALAAALLDGRAQIVEWRFEMLKDKVLWRRNIRNVERAAPAIAREPAEKPAPPPAMPQGGPDLLILNDGRYFRGSIVRRDDKAVVIRTFVGQSEMEMTFKPDEVKEIQAPEKR